MWNIALAGLRAHRRRLLATSSAVLLGVAFLAGTLMLGDSMAQGFDRLFGTVNAGTDVVVRSASTVGSGDTAGRGSLDASIVERVRAVPGVARAVGTIDGIGQIVGHDGQRLGGNGPPTLASNWNDDPRVNPFHLVAGHVPDGPGQVVIDRGSAVEGGLEPGSATTVLTPEPVPVTVVGVAAFGDEDRAGTATNVWFDTERARQHLLGGQDRFSTVLVTTRPGGDDASVLTDVRRVLPPGVEALTGAALAKEQRAAVDDDFLGFLRTFLVVFSGVAMLVAAFSIHNTFSVVAAQRQRESALLRALGATRGQVLRSVAVEVLAVGVVASALGVAAGAGLAVGLQALLSATGLGVPVDGLVVTPTSVVVALLVGVVATVLAGLTPALAASRIAPLAALREVATDHVGGLRRRGVVGVIVAIAGLLLLTGPALGLWSGPLGWVGVGAVLSLVGLLVLGPVLARPVANVLGAPVRRVRGVSGGLARRNAARNPRRTSATASALMVGVGVVTLFTVFGASLTSYVDRSVARSIRADLVVQNDSFGGAGLPPELAGALARVPGVATAAPLGEGAVAVVGAPAATRELSVTVADPLRLGAVADLDVTTGSLAGLGSDGIAVSVDEAKARGWRQGSSVPLRFADGSTERFRVQALFDNTDVSESVLLPQAVWGRHTAQPSVFMVMVGAAGGADLDRVRSGVDAVAARYSVPPSMDHGQYVERMSGRVSTILGIVYVLLALSIVIALMGIANTLSLSVMERTRELGLLRAVGQTRGQVRSMVRWEAVLIAVFGTLLGLAVGVVAGWGLVGATIGSQVSGVFSAPIGRLVVIVVVGAAAGVLAGVRPAARAARLDVLDAIATA
jgi:putative ABC transport system permease protein